MLDAVAATISAVKIVPNLMPDVYEFFLPAGDNNVGATTAAIAQLKGNPHLRWVGGNIIGKLLTNSVTPNDPLFGQMWPLTQNINMPQAWALQKV